MQFQFWSAVLLFLGSYLPLAVILMVQDIATKYWSAPLCGWKGQWNCQFQILAHSWLAWGTVAVTFGALLLMVVALRSVRLPHRVHVQEVKAIPNDLINYVLPYVVSFMGLSYADPEVSPHFFLRDQALGGPGGGRRCAHGARFKVIKPEKSADHA
ncbi:hypothetical protein QT697_20660, partial [Xanthomonas citri pv. citri]